ncbi:YiiX/YebB-like N1pC/P60 family cysteine hydrolase [Bacillus swezeyi]|uniref:YiiX/YebB-like N1pC/P60 family cysteine hydrolase n=1 Tax=Bacillus swezeyi TaxID=1925020 RepID=UPI002E1FFA94|nr:YiiX/YebB-like N1pC/P60 family cysteine hydrolase [Bacillus swezeyi]MED2979714.1 YiiX/YebB-like N1pC/P60 family cysteine hydrolase [Bacillus swezeyi]
MKIIRRVLTLLLLFGCIFSQTHFAQAVSYSNGKVAKAGDVLISKSSKDNYFVGHVAIVGENKESAIEVYNGRTTVKSSSLSTWLKNQSTGYYVQRYNNSSIGYGAGSWASYNAGAKYNYRILSTSALRDWKDLYCSKFVYQAFYYSAGIKLKAMGPEGQVIEYPPTSSLILQPFSMTYMSGFTRIL